MVANVVKAESQIVEESARGVPAKSSLARDTFRDTFVFLAGAEAFHTFSHIWLGLSGMLPMEIRSPSITVTHGLNVFAIIVNAIITTGLLFGATRFSRMDISKFHP